MSWKVEIDSSGNFRDPEKRVITLRGINLAADSKLPALPDVPSHVRDDFFDGDNVSFVGRPFAIDKADEHLARIKSWGFNTIRYIFCWEAIEHAGPGKYDDDFIDSTIEILTRIKKFGFYVFMDPHQDVWSRFSGGSGAPMWTLYAAGLNPESFAANEAAIVQNTWPDPYSFPRMTWATNYDRLACLVLFTMFWGGNDFFPKAIIDGKNIQDYLQEHYLQAIKYFAKRIYMSEEFDDGSILGWESMNEPFRGLIGNTDLSIHPEYEKLKSYTSPTPFEAILLGSGRTVEVPLFEFGSLGPYKTGSQIVNPDGVSAWLSPDYDDSRYGWTRDSGWKLGECIFAQHKIWDPKTDTLLLKDYFAADPKGTPLDGDRWTTKYFLNHWLKYADTIRSIEQDAILFCQTPVLAPPPNFKALGALKPRMVFTPHYYDGLTLIRKHWSSFWNVDVVGVLRGKYWSPVFALKFGENAIRNCLRNQLQTLKDEGIESFGQGVPCLMSEIGIPFDMNDKKAYSNGDYSTQIRALDANIFALEGANLHHTFWVYSATNSHKWGDRWNGEDLSFFSESDLRNSEGTQFSFSSTSSLFSAKRYFETSSDVTDTVGARAVEAFARAFPLVTVGIPQSYSFDIKTATFKLELYGDGGSDDSLPTEIFVPDFHYPNGDVQIAITSGRWELDRSRQVLYWWHEPGKQQIEIVGIRGEQKTVPAKDYFHGPRTCSWWC
ncbi:glycoside hydrolase superfamily [Lipomyces japonicus]|uniref:glycoside hydrolase superfamily n=1 Tax=Lipomyces japonicus TaxID=56871 RepID=UPI0034CFDF1D